MTPEQRQHLMTYSYAGAFAAYVEAVTIKWAVEGLSYRWPDDAATRQKLFDLEVNDSIEYDRVTLEEIEKLQRLFYEHWDDCAADAERCCRFVAEMGWPYNIESADKAVGDVEYAAKVRKAVARIKGSSL